MLNGLVSWHHSSPNAEPPKFKSSIAGLEVDPPSRCGLPSKEKAWWSCWTSCPLPQVECLFINIMLGSLFQSSYEIQNGSGCKCCCMYWSLLICKFLHNIWSLKWVLKALSLNYRAFSITSYITKEKAENLYHEFQKKVQGVMLS